MQVTEYPCEGTKVFLLEDILTTEQCAVLMKYFTGISDRQTIQPLPALSGKLWEYIGQPLLNYDFGFTIKGIEERMTLTQSYNPLGRHRDNGWEKGGWKLAFYLNQLEKEGGTNFYEHGEMKVRIANKIGSGILFDMKLEHESQPTYRQRKFMLGARPIVKI